MKRTSLAVAGAFAGVFLFSCFAGPARADSAADRCGAAKLKAAAGYAQAVLRCHGAGVRDGAAVDSDCLVTATARLSRGFAKAETRGGCVTSSDTSTTGAAIDSDVGDFLAALPYDDVAEARACAAKKLKASGIHYASRSTCYSKSAKKSALLEQDCLTRADAKLDDAFSKADARGGCTATGDAGAVQSLGGAAVTDIVAALSPACGDDVVGPTQVCDGISDAACPGNCLAGCSCFVPPVCPNGVAEYPEECDDGNAADGDGCSATCELENASALCAGVAPTAGSAIDAVLVTDAVTQPIYATAPPLDPTRLFIVSRAGAIWILDLATGAVLPAPFLDISDLVSIGSEQGLLSMAFDPNYESNGRFFVNYTDQQGDTAIARYQRSAGDPNLADAGSGVLVLEIHQPFSNHNGGQIAFGADGYLYVGMGDGGGGGDPQENAQDDTTLLGKMLRLDVSVATAPYYAAPPTNPGYTAGTELTELIWAKGLRNPWRFSFDTLTGDMLIADVGQNQIEEIDFQPASSTGGENYGWDVFEGDMCFEPAPDPTCPSPPTGFTFPVDSYTHGPGCSVTGGFVYRGCAMPDLGGTYFYSDYCAPFFRTFEISGGIAVNLQDRTSQITPGGPAIDFVASFGQDARGELYILNIEGGRVYRIVPGS
ncbi:MAG: PQQ-dependent sugar dehydrogenase [Deltaproteobacteria bacterium]|nr:PQQ-dependent sugar dehydrogenase [Deltaproteobacteria bacterium]